MSWQTEDWRRLRSGIIGPHRKRYETQASFKATVDALCQMVQLFVDAAAVRSDEAEKRQRELIDLMKGLSISSDELADHLRRESEAS